MIDLDTTDRKNLLVEEVAEILRVSERCVYYWIESGKLPSIHIGDTYRIPVAILRKLMPTDQPDPSLFKHSLQSAKRAR